MGNGIATMAQEPNSCLTSPIDAELEGSTQTDSAFAEATGIVPSTCENVDSSRRPYKAKVGGSTPSAPTRSDLQRYSHEGSGMGLGPLHSPHLFPPSAATEAT